MSSEPGQEKGHFALVMVGTRGDWQAIPPAEQQRLLGAYFAWVDAQVERGRYVGGEGLQESPPGTPLLGPPGPPFRDPPILGSQNRGPGFQAPRT